MSLKIATVVLNWNGEDHLANCVDSLLTQTHPTTVIVVDNDSHDSSKQIMSDYGDKIIPLYNKNNAGFSGGVNPGIRYAIDHNFDAVALLNPDAVADNDWIANLAGTLSGRPDSAIVTGCLQSIDGKRIDSTGDQLTVWGLPYPRGRGAPVESAFNSIEEIFGASGGGSVYRISTLKEIGLFDEDFFMYYEDVDISFRAQLYGWKVIYNPSAIAYHHIGASSGKVKGLTTYQSLSNWPLVIIKNVPRKLLIIILPRFIIAYIIFIGSSALRGQLLYALRGVFHSMTLWPKKFRERKVIQKNRKVTDNYILSIMTHDLPENQTKLRKLRSIWWKAFGKPGRRQK